MEAETLDPKTEWQVLHKASDSQCCGNSKRWHIGPPLRQIAVTNLQLKICLYYPYIFFHTDWYFEISEGGHMDIP